MTEKIHNRTDTRLARNMLGLLLKQFFLPLSHDFSVNLNSVVLTCWEINSNLTALLSSPTNYQKSLTAELGIALSGEEKALGRLPVPKRGPTRKLKRQQSFYKAIYRLDKG